MNKKVTIWWGPKLFHLLVFSLLYYFAVVIGLETRIGQVALFWPANGVAFCFFILRPKREWPLYLLCLSLGYISGMYATGDYPWPIILGVLLANIIQTVVGALLVKRFIPEPHNFSSMREIIITLFFTAIVGSFASAFFSVSLLGAGFMETPWQLWLSGVIDNAGSTVVTLPFMLIFINNFTLAKWRSEEWRRWLEGFALLLATLVLANYIFSFSYRTDVFMRTLPYLLIPSILWAGLRFGQQGVTLGILMITTIVVWRTLLNEGPFATVGAGFNQVLTIHMYLSVLAITGLVVAALMKQQVIAMQSLAGGIAHEMRNPLGFIRYSLYSIRDRLDDDRSAKLPADALSIMRSAVSSADKAINRSLQFIDITLNSLYSKSIDTRKFEFLSAQDCVEKAVREYSFSSEAERNKVSLDIKRDFIFKGDETLLLHVLFNLMKNALYYLTHSSGQVSIKLELAEGMNQIVVRDNGPGISAQAIQHLFDSFFTVGKQGGTGLGLAYCQRVMRAFGGDIQCESTEGEYTAFILSFPHIIEEELVAYQEKQLAPLAGRKILIVDDDMVFIRQFLDALPEHRLDISLENNIQFAISRMRKEPFDLIVMDNTPSVMCDMDGIGWIRKGAAFAADECVNHKTIPIVIFSANTATVDRGSALAEGATGFIPKNSQPLGFLQGLVTALAVAEKQDEILDARDSLKNVTILVVDDERMNRVWLRRLLESKDIQVLEAEGGETALAILEQKNCDAIITDLQMPGMDGWQLASKIRTCPDHQAYAEIPIIALSGNPRHVKGQDRAASTINAFLTKPFDIELLLETVRQQVKRYSAVTNERKSNETQYKEQEQIARIESEEDKLATLLHDIATPTLTIETHSKLLGEQLPILIKSYRLQGRTNNMDTPLSDAMLANLQTVSDTMAHTVAGIRRKHLSLRRIYNDEYGTGEEPVDLAVDDIDLFWQWVDTMQSTIWAPCLPLLLAAYEQTSVAELPESQVIDDDAWQSLNRTVIECANAVERVMKSLGQYKETNS